MERLKSKVLAIAAEYTKLRTKWLHPQEQAQLQNLASQEHHHWPRYVKWNPKKPLKQHPAPVGKSETSKFNKKWVLK